MANQPLSASALVRVTPPVWDTRIVVEEDTGRTRPTQIFYSFLVTLLDQIGVDDIEVTRLGEVHLLAYTSRDITAQALTDEQLVYVRGGEAYYPLPASSETGLTLQVGFPETKEVKHETIVIDGSAGALTRYKPVGEVEVLFATKAMSTQGREISWRQVEPGVFALSEPGFFTASVRYQTAFRRIIVKMGLLPESVSESQQKRLLTQAIRGERWDAPPVVVLVQEADRPHIASLVSVDRPVPRQTLITWASSLAQNAGKDWDLTEVSRQTVPQKVYSSHDPDVFVDVNVATVVVLEDENGRKLTLRLSPP